VKWGTGAREGKEKEGVNLGRAADFPRWRRREKWSSSKKEGNIRLREATLDWQQNRSSRVPDEMKKKGS